MTPSLGGVRVENFAGESRQRFWTIAKQPGQRGALVLLRNELFLFQIVFHVVDQVFPCAETELKAAQSFLK